MKKLIRINGLAIPLAMNNVDTDLIIPAQYLTNTEKTGYGIHLFKRLRDNNFNFVFNQKKFLQANILITQANFGCGSSREHAVWALQEAGIQAIIALSFADIFFSNAMKNGLVLITLPENTINSMLTNATEQNYFLTIDIEKQIIFSEQNNIYSFEFDSFRKYCLMRGLDELDYLLKHKEQIALFKKAQEQKNY